MNFTFDDNGYLYPPKIFETDIHSFETIFATNERRSALYNVLQNYILDLKTTLNSPFQMWIDGSFVTQKKMPNDIDLVTFVNAPNYFYNEEALWELLKKYRRLDAHYSIVYSFHHRLRRTTDWDMEKYKELFLSDRDNIKKGLIQLNF
jgi:glycosyltransferase involved in cell wall biosynthesis